MAGFQWHRAGNLLYVTGSESQTLDPKVQGRRLQIYSLNYVASRDVEPVVTRLLSPIGKAFASEASDFDQLKTRELLVVEDNDSGHSRVAQYLAQIDIPPLQDNCWRENKNKYVFGFLSDLVAKVICMR